MVLSIAYQLTDAGKANLPGLRRPRPAALGPALALAGKNTTILPMHPVIRTFTATLACLLPATLPCLIAQEPAPATATHPPANLTAGPMLGYSTMAEVLIWAQTNVPATVQIRYWEEGQPNDIRWSAPCETRPETAHVAKCLADRVTWGKRYVYEVLVDGRAVTPLFPEGALRQGAIPLRFQTPPNWRFRETGHEVFDFRVATGSCAYINEGGYDRLNSAPYGAEYGIFEQIYEKTPDLMVWLGDNVYLREPDWTSRTGLYHRWSHDRALPEMRALLASAHHYGIWDDHDYGPNNAGWDFWNKAATREAFLLFHGNPSAGLPELPGIFTFFNWGDVNFYLCDNRTYRDSDGTDPAPFGKWKRHLGREQVEWLVNAMKWSQHESRSSYPISFHVVCSGSQILSDNPYPENYRTYRDEWQYLIDRLLHERIDGIVFLTGDVHFSEMSRETFTGGGLPGVAGKAGELGLPHTMVDLTVSPFTSGPHRGAAPNSKRVVDFLPRHEGLFRGRNFATLDFTGPGQDRRLTIRLWDSQGRLLNQQPGGAPGEVTPPSIITAAELKAPQPPKPPPAPTSHPKQ